MSPADDINRIDTPPIHDSTSKIDDSKDVAWQEFSGEHRAERTRWGLYLGAGAAGLGALIGGVSVFAIVAALRDDPASRNRIAAKSEQPAVVQSAGRSEASSPLAESPVGRIQPCSYQDWLDQKCPNRNAPEPQRDTSTAAAPPAASPAPIEPPAQAPVVTRITPAPAAPSAPAAAPAQAPAPVTSTTVQAPPDPAKPYVQKVEPARIDPSQPAQAIQPAQPPMNTAGASPIEPAVKAGDAGKKKKPAKRPGNDQPAPASTNGSAPPAATLLPPREGRTIEATVTEPAEERRGFFGLVFGGERREQVIVREPLPERAAPATQRSRAVTQEEAAPPKGKKKAARSRVAEDDDEDEAAPRQGRGAVRIVVEEEAPPVVRRSPFGFFRFD